ncbi:MAG: hypothetical protein IJ449_08535 [Clostridia bacterium]|nr:hypothetical protein [Clostridia bacterium]
MQKKIQNENEKEAFPETAAPGEITSQKRSSRENWITMLVCIFSAVCIWFYVMSVDSPTSTEAFSSVTVSILNERDASQDTGLTAISGTNSVIEVTLKGRKTVLNELKAEDIEAYVDVSGTTVSGKGVYTVTVEAPAGTVIEDYYPKEITVYMDKKSIISVPVECRLSEYTVSSDYSLNVSEPTSLSVNAIQVTGPESELEKVAAARMTLNPGTITQSFSGTAPLELIDESGNVITSKYLTLSATEATASYSVYTTKYLDLNVEYKYGYFAENGTTVTISPSRVLVRGLVEKLANMTSNTVATIDETKITEDGIHGYDLNLPDGIELVDAGGQTSVSVNIHFGGSSLRKVTIPASQINVINVPDGKRVDVLSETLVVSVRGTSQEVRYLTANDIDVVADVSLAGSNGEQYISVSAALKDGNSAGMYAVGDYTVQIRVEDKE